MTEELYEFSSEASRKLCEKVVNLAASLGKRKGDELQEAQEVLIQMNIRLLRLHIKQKTEISDVPDIVRAKETIRNLYRTMPV